MNNSNQSNPQSPQHSVDFTQAVPVAPPNPPSSPSGHVVVQAHAVQKSFPGRNSKSPATPVIKGVSLQIRAGEMVSIVGPSGSGKSTLLYVLSGLEDYNSGSVRLMGYEVNQLTRSGLAALRRDHVGFVFQSFNLIPSLTAYENVSLPARLARKTVDHNSLNHALHSVGLSQQRNQRPGELSGGQQQRVAIARVLAMNPSIVFADEPTGSLDSKNGKDVLNLLRMAASGNRSVVVVTHDLEAAALADRVLVLRDGVVHHELIKPTTDQVYAAFMSAQQVA